MSADRLAWLAWLAIAVGCRVPALSGDTGAASCERRIELGTGVDGFQPVADGDPLRMVFGPQGGYHVPLALRGCRVGEPLRTHVVGVSAADGRVVVDASLTHVWVAEDACCGVLLDLRGYLFSADGTDWDPTTLDGERLTLDYGGEELATDAGEPLSDQVEVVLLAP